MLWPPQGEANELSGASLDGYVAVAKELLLAGCDPQVGPLLQVTSLSWLG